MFVSPRFRDVFGSGPIRTRRRERPAAPDRTETAIRELDERLSNAEAILLDFVEAPEGCSWRTPPCLPQ